jgi:hypothetical protein
MSESAAIAAVRAWHDAVNEGDVARVVSHVSPDVIFVGPRGESRGAAVIEGWVERARMRLVPTGWYARGDRVVVEEEAAWVDAATGTLSEPTLVATSFTVHDGKITRLARYDTTGEALTDAGLGDADGIDIEGAPDS